MMKPISHAVPLFRILAVLIGLVSLFPLLVPSARAEEQAPDALIKKVTGEVLDILRTDKDLKAGKTEKAVELIEAKVLPHFDFNRMTALAVGREWRNATPEQKKAITDEFHTLLVRTYSNALTAYKNQTVEYKPFKASPGETDVVVRSQVKQAGSKPVDIDYSVQKNGSGAWKVYDVVVGGVSLVTSYRDQFRQQVSTGGIDGLIKSLQAKNQSPTPPPAPTSSAK